MITLYSTHCPVCNQVEAMLKKKNMPYEVVDKFSKVMEMAEPLGITEVPFAIIDEEVYTTAALKEYIETEGDNIEKQ